MIHGNGILMVNRILMVYTVYEWDILMVNNGY